MFHIHLNNLRFRCFHGVFAEESMLGNEYEVSLSLAFQPGEWPVTHLHDTLDYTAVYQLVKNQMSVPTPLLETLACRVSDEIRAVYPQVTGIRIEIKKLYPPLNSFEGSVGVSFEWNK